MARVKGSGITMITIKDVTDTAYSGRYPWGNDELLFDFIEFSKLSPNDKVTSEVLLKFREFRTNCYLHAIKLVTQ